MATFVLVHPAWFGGWCWKKVSSLLRSDGHDVYTPTMTGLGERAHLAAPAVGLGVHIDDVVEAMTVEDLTDAIVVGNSSGGTVITGVADRVPERIDKLVYLDAFVPEDGQSTRDLIAPERRVVMERLVESEGDGWLLPRFAEAPWDEFVPKAWEVTGDDLTWVLQRLRPTPFRHFTEPIRLKGGPGGEGPPRVYVRCTRNPHPGFDRFAEAAQSKPSWSRRDMPAAHLPYITEPEELTALLVEIATRRRSSARS
jgi:pimeloyl-ACP methyl ester carboxylesterase